MTVGEAALALQDHITGRATVATNPPVKVTINTADVASAARVLAEKIDQLMFGERARMASERNDDGRLWKPAIDTGATSAREQREQQERIFRAEMRRLEAAQYGTEARLPAPRVEGGSAALAAEDATLRRVRSAEPSLPRLERLDELRAEANAAADAARRERRARAMNGVSARGAEALERARALGDPAFVTNLERIARGEVIVAPPVTADEEAAWQAAKRDIERARRDAEAARPVEPSRQVWPALRTNEVGWNEVGYTTEYMANMQEPPAITTVPMNMPAYMTEDEIKRFIVDGESVRIGRAGPPRPVRLQTYSTFNVTAPDGWLIDNVSRELVHMDTSKRISLMALFAVPPADIPDTLRRVLEGRPAPVPTGTTAAPPIAQLDGKRRIRLTDED